MVAIQMQKNPSHKRKMVNLYTHNDSGKLKQQF